MPIISSGRASHSAMRAADCVVLTSLKNCLAAGMLMVSLAPWTAAVGAAQVLQPVSSTARYVAAAAQRFAIPEAWIYAVMRVESAGGPRALSPKGAKGLMQLMPSTWRDLRARYGLGFDIYDAHDNIVAGTAYMRELYDRYGAPGFLAAYNAGPTRYEAYLQAGRPLPAETVSYLAKLAPVTGPVAGAAETADRPDPLAWTQSGVFVGDGAIAPIASAPDAAAKVPEPPDRTPPPPFPTLASIFVPLSGRQPR